MKPAARPRLHNLKIWSNKPKRRRSRASPCQIAALRLTDLARLFRARYGTILPDDDAGRDDIAVAVNHLASLAHPKGRITKWLEIWAPWMTLAERSEILTEAITKQQHWTADQLAWRLRLTDADRTALAITTIGAVDCSKRERTKRRKLKARERAKWHKRRRKLAELERRLRSVTQHKAI